MTPQRAREMVTRVISTVWPEDAGTLYVVPQVYADAHAFLMVYGPREWLVDRDPAFLRMDALLALVDRDTGALSWTTYLMEPDRFDSMRPVT